MLLASHKVLRRITAIALSLLTLAAPFIESVPAYAALSLSQVQAQVTSLQQQASDIAERAQQSQVDLNNLNRTLVSVQQQAGNAQTTVNQFQKSLGNIAAEQYKGGDIGQGMQLLFSSNPSLYLGEAGVLETVTKQKALQLKQYLVAKQRLVATSLTVSAKLALVHAARAEFLAREAAANLKLRSAQMLVSKLSKAQRIRLAALNAKRDSSYQTHSLAQFRKLHLGSTRGAVALRFAIKQLGDRYVFGAAGPVWWDCSGLTMRAFGSVGVSLPHSAAYQFGHGAEIRRSELKAGDMVFFGRPITHVGIYLGGGEMVDAPHSGARVRVESFGSYFGDLPFVGARRI
jgi:cell wall-associated NlpC family hydrolase